MQNEIDRHLKDKESLNSELAKIKSDLEETRKNLESIETEKKRLENIVQRSNQQVIYFRRKIYILRPKNF